MKTQADQLVDLCLVDIFHIVVCRGLRNLLSGMILAFLLEVCVSISLAEGKDGSESVTYS